MFFYLSKILWFVFTPGNALLLALCLGLILLMTRWRRLGRWLVSLWVLTALTLTFVPVGGWMLYSLENRFPVPATLPDKIDGIVVLGGVIDPRLTMHRGTPALNGAVERITVSAALAKAHPEARLIFTAGSGRMLDDIREADYVVSLYQQLGIAESRLLLDRDARNTWENAERAYALATPKPDENWILVTSASHMPRAVGVFRRIGWSMIAYPVDFRTYLGQTFSPLMSFGDGLGSFSNSLHEWIGLTAYWLTGKTGAAFPKPWPKEG